MRQLLKLPSSDPRTAKTQTQIKMLRRAMAWRRATRSCRKSTLLMALISRGPPTRGPAVMALAGVTSRMRRATVGPSLSYRLMGGPAESHAATASSYMDATIRFRFRDWTKMVLMMMLMVGVTIFRIFIEFH